MRVERNRVKKGVNEKIKLFLAKRKELPILESFIVGLYPFLFYFSNNFSAINSSVYLAYFLLIFIVLPILIFIASYFIFVNINKFNKYRKQFIFVLILVITSSLLSQAMFLVINKKFLILMLILSIPFSFKFSKYNKKLIILIVIMSVIPFVKCIVHIYEHAKPMSWTQISDDIEKAVFVSTPNIYVIQPDGYVSQNVMESKPYSHSSDLYNWLEDSGFKLYDNFRSNYPASLASNASMFAMKQHYFGDMLMPTFELPNARDVISGNNSVISIFKNNNYKTHFIVQDEYFQQSTTNQHYDYYNINIKEIPFFSNDNNIKKVVFDDLRVAMNLKSNAPNFYFIEKLLPHHSFFNKSYGKNHEIYTTRIDSVNVWIKNTIDYIIKEDDNSLIVLLADHGGWLGVKNFDEMFSTNKEENINSIFSSLAAIRWGGFLKEDYDANLQTNVNLFRVLFASLSENESYLEYLEENSSYNLHKENSFYNSVYQVIDNEGNVVFNKH